MTNPTKDNPIVETDGYETRYWWMDSSDQWYVLNTSDQIVNASKELKWGLYREEIHTDSCVGSGGIQCTKGEMKTPTEIINQVLDLIDE